MTPNPRNNGGGLGPVVDIWIEDTGDGQALFVATTTSDGHEATAAIWQPTNPTTEESTDVW